ncbi:hypothetical protein RHMOL_Rhmol13G0148000 [Rhododendron molle]|uniref:Uncharacterized protein n=1 Tax=Rhododendron molle TaxID=49168 RepID=A0ACC0L6R6_RHOML|nr:hypothetical protein RHMOL_Rhmol13G0148000 [Rhododendron molle]
MAIHQLNLAHENQLKALKLQGSKQKDQMANGISFWALLFSIFVFVSVFYIFNLSPSSLLNTTKFWFFISNTLILIIAVDFGASNKQAEIYKECMEESMGNIIRFPSFECRYPEKEIAETNNPPHPEKKIAKTNIPEQKEKNLQETQEEVKEVIVDVVRKRESRESKMQVVAKVDLKMCIEEPEGKMVEFHSKVDHEKVHEKEKERETSIGNERPNEKEEEGRQEEEGRREEEEEEEEEDDDEFSKMSNEELNKRIEEFIQRFNGQIRLQAAQNRIRQMQRCN